MQKVEENILFKYLAVVSVLLLVVPHTITFAFSEALLLGLVISRMRRINRSKVKLSFLLLLLQFFSVLINFGRFELIEIIKSVNFILLLIVVQPQDLRILYKVLKYLGIPLILIMLIDGYFWNFIPNNHAARMDQLLGVVPSRGLFYEFDYSGIFNLLLFMVMPYVWAPFAFGTILLSGFKTSLPFLVIKPLKFTSMFLRVCATVSVIAMPWILYFLGPIFFEQRYFIWKGVIPKLLGWELFTRNDVQDILLSSLIDSPWGLSGLNLHSGMFESILYRGLPYSVVALLLVFRSIRNSSALDFKMLLIFIGIVQMFSLSLGGTGLPSLLFTILVIVNLNKNETVCRYRG